jgi:hypothetical protein
MTSPTCLVWQRDQVDGYVSRGEVLGDTANASVQYFDREHTIDPRARI